jgi:hypothetical protein
MIIIFHSFDRSCRCANKISTTICNPTIFTWREDESNAETKYQRNKVGNQLILLLEELVGGADFLEKRLQSYQQQSEEIHSDLTPRVVEYLHRVLEKNGKGFQLHTTTTNVIQRVRSHLDDHSENTDWTLQLGSSYNVVRRGVILMVQEKNGSESRTTPWLNVIELKWYIVKQDDLLSDDGKAKVSKSLLLALPNGWSNENALKLLNAMKIGIT